jgi:O-antigen/teichoic acid export membrane protein
MCLYGLRSYGIDLCGALAQYVDQALVLGMLSAVEMGSYVVCLSLSRILNTIAIAASTVLFPRSVGASPRQAVLSALRTQIAVTSLASCGALLMLLLGTPALRLLYGSKYADASSVLKILILEALLSGAITIMSQPFMALGRPGVVTMLQVTGLLFTIPGIVVLVPRYGTSGACIALVMSACLRLVLLAGAYRRILPGVIEWRKDGLDLTRQLLAMARSQFLRGRAA